MCGRWYVDLMSDEELNEYYSKLKDKNIKATDEIFPTDNVLVIANNKNGNQSVFNMKFGYNVGNNIVFNARSETLYEKKIFLDGILNRRCVIPANYYFEWQKDSKEKNVIKNNNSKIMYFIGIYRFENNNPVFTIITKDASDNMKELHPRMPVIISKDKINDWLSHQNNLNYFINNSINDLYYSKVN